MYHSNNLEVGPHSNGVDVLKSNNENNGFILRSLVWILAKNFFQSGK